MAETEFKYDVFISYSHKDEEWVHDILLPTLENHGVKVCIDFRDFVGGSPSIKEMERAVKESRKTLPILTPNYLASGWSDFELSIAQTLDPGNQDLRVIPLLKTQCELPLRINYLSYIDFTKKDNDTIAWRQLLIGLGKQVAIEEPIQIPSSTQWFLPYPYAMPQNFTGRVAELQMLDKWLIEDDRLFIIRAFGGFGKSALAWQWISKHVKPGKWTKLAWWSFYEGNASFEHFIEETLKYLKLEVPQGQRLQVDELLRAMQSQKILLIMDGFERVLRAYSSMNFAYQGDDESSSSDSGGGDRDRSDCVSVNAQIFLQKVCSLPNMKSKVLMTTRLNPRVVKPHDGFLQGCREKELKEMDKADAVAFFRVQGIRGIRAEIESVCEPYGYHPLSLRLLAGRILKDFENPGDIIVGQKLKIDGDLKQRRHHILEVSYNSLLPREQKLLSTIACFRWPVELKILQSIAENKDALNDGLHDLVERGLLHFDDKNKKFDLHPIVRRYAYERLTAPDRIATHTRLMDYFESVPQPAKIENLEELTPMIELYHHKVRAGQLDDAIELYDKRLKYYLYFQFGGYQNAIELLKALFLDGENKLPKLKEDTSQAWALHELANSYSLSGQLRRAVPLYEMQNILQEKIGDKESLAIGLGAVAKVAQLHMGLFKEAEHNLFRQIDLCREIRVELFEANGYQELGHILSYRGAWQEAEQEFSKSLKITERISHIQNQGLTWSYRALLFLLMAREKAIFDIRDSEVEYQISSPEYLQSAIRTAERALELAEEQAKKDRPIRRDYIRAYWLLGAAYRMSGKLDKAEENLSKAINMCRQINLVESEASILLDLTCLRYDQKNYEEAKSLAEEALLITERCGYVLQGADVNLFLAQYVLEQEKDKAKAKEYAETALKLAYCDGPPYYYKVAYHEAERMLEQLK